MPHGPIVLQRVPRAVDSEEPAAPEGADHECGEEHDADDAELQPDVEPGVVGLVQREPHRVLIGGREKRLVHQGRQCTHGMLSGMTDLALHPLGEAALCCTLPPPVTLEIKPYGGPPKVDLPVQKRD